MLFSRLVEYFGRIEGTSLRNAKTEILAEILKEAEMDEIDKLVYLALGGLRPAYDRLEFNLAEKMILRVMGASDEQYQQVGDLGELVVKMKQTNKLTDQQPNLSVDQVYIQLEKIALESGTGSQERKIDGLRRLIGSVDPVSAKYIVRMVAGKLRLGFSDKTVIDALSYMEKGTKEYSEIIDRAYQRRPDPGVLAKMVKEKGAIEAAKSLSVAIGTPVVPALAQRLKTAKEMIEKMGRVIVEKKFDGTRVQIHFSRKINKLTSKLMDQQTNIQQEGLFGEEEKPQFWVRTFTRNLDESSDMFPELQSIADQIKADEVILDSEAVGYDPKSGKLVPFQLTITRKRKHGIAEAQSSVPLKFFVFDIMYKDGQSLIHLPLRARKKILGEVIVDRGTSESVLVVDEYIETDNPDVLREYHARQLAGGLEGALVKQVDGTYMPGRTGFNWVKFKESEDSRAKLADTIDAVIMGYDLGKGKRQKFGIGAFLIGIKAGEDLVTLAKVGIGISDEQFRELYIKLTKQQTKEKNQDYVVSKTLIPDVWVEPSVVVEVAADEITVSPAHTARYALRFPRLVKFRDDKGVAQITTLSEIKEMVGI